jgi:ABC-type lipoprotein export system ATPase subunit
LIEARDLGRDFDSGRVHALRGVDLTIRRGEFVSIAGPSGCGKSSLLQLIGALDRPTKGELTVNGERFTTLRDMSRFRARTIGFVFQAFCLLPTLTAIENVQIPMFEMPWRRSERLRRARLLIEAVGLTEREDHFPAELSGGERQRVAIARSLANDPPLLLADEPTGNLDSASAARVMDLLRSIHEERAATLLVVTHDPAVAAYAHRRIRMLDGRIVEDKVTGRETAPGTGPA